VASTIREQIIAAVVTRLAVVLTAKGFNTSAGTYVARAGVNLDQDNVPALNVIPQSETVRHEYGASHHEMLVKVEAVAVHGTTNASVVAEQLLGDLIEAMCGIRWSLAFTSGGTYVVKATDTVTGALSGATAYVEAVTVATGAWATGDAAGTLTLRRLDGTFRAENLNVGASLNVATIAGVPTGTKPATLATAGLAEGVRYVEGGPTQYPEADDYLTGCSATFQIDYVTNSGDPYTQP